MQQTKLDLWLCPFDCVQRQNPRSEPPAVYPDLSTYHGWLAKNAIADLPVRLKGDLMHTPR